MESLDVCAPKAPATVAGCAMFSASVVEKTQKILHPHPSSLLSEYAPSSTY